VHKVRALVGIGHHSSNDHDHRVSSRSVGRAYICRRLLESDRASRSGFPGNTRARVRKQKNGRIEINGRIQLGDYRTSHGYVSRGLPATIEVRSGTLRINGRVTAGDGVRLQVQGGTLTIGDRTFFDGDTRIVCTTAVTIGSGDAMGWGCNILDCDFHTIDGAPMNAPVVIGDDVWIGINAMILKGVVIGDGASSSG
jgi:NDP-sugar pyrophosphorylase family protein